MTSSDIVKELFSALDSGNYTKADSYLDNNFKFSGPTPTALGKAEFLAFEKAMRASTPNVDHGITVSWESKDGEVRGEAHVRGTHTKDLNLPMIPLVKATNKSYRLPAEKYTAWVKNGKIASIAVDTPTDGGVIGMLTQIGREDIADCLRTKGLNCRADYEETGSTRAHI
jgi:hypothetical protein